MNITRKLRARPPARLASSSNPLARLRVVAQHARPPRDAKHPHRVLQLLAGQV